MWMPECRSPFSKFAIKQGTGGRELATTLPLGLQQWIKEGWRWFYLVGIWAVTFHVVLRVCWFDDRKACGRFCLIKLVCWSSLLSLRVGPGQSPPYLFTSPFSTLSFCIFYFFFLSRFVYFLAHIAICRWWWVNQKISHNALLTLLKIDQLCGHIG